MKSTIENHYFSSIFINLELRRKPICRVETLELNFLKNYLWKELLGTGIPRLKIIPYRWILHENWFETMESSSSYLITSYSSMELRKDSVSWERWENSFESCLGCKKWSKTDLVSIYSLPIKYPKDPPHKCPFIRS